MARPIANPPNPWHSHHVEYLGEPPPAELVVYEQNARSILSRNDSPDLPFRYSLNPYRGCFHACAYCYARPSHQHLDFGAGTDFERKIVVKVNADERLAATLSRRGWERDVIVFSGNTDCYQPIEASYELTRRCLEVCAAYRQPVGLITKGALIERDIDVLQRIQRYADVHVHVSIPFFDAEIARAIEPHVPTPARRLRTVRALASAGLNVGVSVAPIIPGLNDDQFVRVLEAAADAGARRAFRTIVRLPGPVAEIFEQTVRERLPLRAQRVMNAIRACKGGALNRTAFGERMVGEGPRWRAVATLFDVTCRRLGLALSERGPEPAPRAQQVRAEQLRLL